MLEFKNVYTQYDSLPVLRDFNLKAAQGKITCLLGSNGAGKTTAIKTILGIVKPTRGTVTFMGERIDNLKTSRIIQKGIATVPEGRRLFPKLTVEENLLLGACNIKDKNKVARNIEKAYYLFPRLEERKKQVAGTLSGGEQQMVALSRALMSEPSLLLMDEPSLGLAPILIKEIFSTIVKINKEDKTTILLIEQNAHKAIEIADYVYVIQKGRVIIESAGDDNLSKKKIEEAYLQK